MNVRTVTIDRLTSDEVAAWSEIQRCNPLLSSPYFRPEYSQAVGAVRRDVEVAVLEEQGMPVGFFPFQRTQWNSGRPVGGQLSDFHGLIAPQELDCDPIRLLRACRLTSWRFDHLLTQQRNFAPFTWSVESSPYVDLSEGFEAYIAGRDNGRSLMAEYGQKKRKLAHEIGPVRFEPHVEDPTILSRLIDWKASQYRRTNLYNIFEFAWVRNLLAWIHSIQTEAFSGMLSVLYAGEHIAAMAFGMRSYGVFHPWFPVYNVEFARYSPGTLNWIETMKVAPDLGIQRMDLEKSAQAYKSRFMSAATSVATGAVDVQPAKALVRAALRHTGDCVRSSSLYTLARGPAHWLSRTRIRMELS